MMRLHSLAGSVTAMIAFAGSIHAQRADAGKAARAEAGRDTVLVSVAWLQPRLQQGDIVVIFAGTKNDYDAGHIPGARHLPPAAFTAQGHDRGHEPTLMTELPTMAQLDSALEAVGVSDGSRIVIYGNPTTAARLYVTLDHAGLRPRISILDGGMTAWRAAGHEAVQDPPPVARGRLTLRPRTDIIADLAAVRGAVSTGGAAILDARLPEFYTGASAGQMPRAGHIPGAKNIPYTTLLAPGATFKDIAALQDLFATAGIAPGGKVITYCHIGMQASVLYVAARAAGYEPRMYDGSFDEWSRRSELPVVRDSTP